MPRYHQKCFFRDNSVKKNSAGFHEAAHVGEPAPRWGSARRLSPESPSRRTPPGSRARQHERLHEPGGIRQHRKIRRAYFWWYRGMRTILFCMLYALPGGGGASAASSKLGAARVTSRTCFRGNAAGRRCPWISVGTVFATRARWASNARCRVISGSLPFADCAFDMAMSVDVLPHLPARPGAPRRAWSWRGCWRRGGLLVVRTAALDILRSRHSRFACERQRFTRRRLMASMAGAGVPVLALLVRQFAAAAGGAGEIPRVGATAP